MRLREISSPVNKIIAVAMTLKNRDEKDDIQTKITMDAFLKMLKNSGVTIDYEGFKKVFDTNPQLKNIIDKFDSDSITLKAGDITDKDAKGFEPPATDIPADERVSKMARKAMRTREDLDIIRLLAGLSESEHSDKAGQIAADSVKGSKFSDKDDLESALLDALPNFPDKDYDRSKAIERAMEILDSELDDMLSERELTKAEKSKMKSYEKKIDKKDFVDRYGKKKGEPYYYATITKMAKKHA
tara:strand:- start:334 stop:1062 length:729 start_codon:yes stop_codon:yes gene_type:complete